MGKRIPVNITLPADLVRQVDAMAGPRNRSAFVEDAIVHRVRRAEMQRALEQAAGMLDPHEYPEWATGELVQAWVRDGRREETDAAPDVDVSAA
jgi:predicted transcriptional regulator